MSLLMSTARAAMGQGLATDAGPATAAAVAQGGKATLRPKLMFAALVLAAGVAGGGVSLHWQRTSDRGSARVPASAPARPQEFDPRHGVRIAATVNGEPVLAEDVYAAAYLSIPEAHDLAAPARLKRSTAVLRKTLDRVVEREVILQEALRILKAHHPEVVDKLQQVAAKEFGRRWVETAKRRAGFKDDEQLSTSLRARGTSLAAVRRQWEGDFIAEQYMQNRVFRGRKHGSTLSDEGARKERERIVAQLKRQAAIEYAGGW
jgi:hypothetical protein